MTPRDTIVATATPPGRGGVAVLRISGHDTPRIATALLGKLPTPRYATWARFRDAHGEAIDFGLALYFPAPHSFTGEPVLELHGHGSPVLQEALIERALQLGARRARPGEFSERAFLEDKLDLAQAEAIADLIAAGSRTAAQAALRSLRGEFSARVDEAEEALIDLRVYVEAAIDFPEEEIDFLSSDEIVHRLARVNETLSSVTRLAREGSLLSEGLTVVIAGRPNAGKSTLMNRLAGYEAAIVTELPGTTRDVLRENLELDGLPVTLIDTAGLRAVAADVVEREGMRRAVEEIRRADRVLFVVDAAADPGALALRDERATLPAGVPVTLVFNKADLVADRASLEPRGLVVSASTGEGLDALRAHLKDAAGY
ncbi:MAG: tRNA uridine-5-carboxymethylaminomethyl(34) synthesis GTPase MnmE, partial [Steroidobacteraceae bacterium]